ncbi:UDP-N-acetylglucosamine--N-acetylmuramyl-(pentapeptide) pyrophosphoryl-undecaprenol N-acetylglucosamine transferase MurG [Clostridium aceticum]|uniref:UDP-N-acetylglucosamine--N-acetylmuramyl-(pentapeptide) pyrophosphoryl-undecaprenol N-acetylglucosamine transferase n=1 Tax=Clostridium aceticum TaxID=84022 RepID=A0A0D8I943_9CLOT|nr:undecaprenyldiphospho-muramoylpentapeptide beta-N-acetylglucosaminyltransferase [Clostridium aceticum]AKL95625.1 UDP-N-acetylglucosamine--N-acetylmuramyl-(pentapeptide) pyrophosphoryl-undecaprenol N-acetylglucosamine transferase MurG [Clostridium aceticum]KJF26805.1 UDP-diphospho-muramoylpentapeptide beta-N-acetylglucosaminyltransferase [Clostridium aceticum]
MKVIISGGGTGGHIYPAIAIASKIKEKHPTCDILFIGTSSGLESDLVPKAGYEIKTITVSYLRRKISLHNLKSAGMLLKGLWEARKIIKDFQPDIVIGTGGFVCGPVVYMASKLGIKTLIHEQNVFPGITNKILGNYVDRIAISFEEAQKYFKQKNKLVVTGNPIREEFFKITSEEASLRYKVNRPLVLIVGGSGGSASINKAVIDMLVEHPRNQFEVLLVTGKRHYKELMEKLSQHKEVLQYNRIIEYMDDMPYALKACDLIICSAGAITITEINAVGKPAILIPKAYTAENHQEYNATALEARGAALVIKEKDLKSDYLLSKIEEILNNKEKLQSMERASLDASKKLVAEKIYQEIIKLLKH